jgi:hypothetical protein
MSDSVDPIGGAEERRSRERRAAQRRKPAAAMALLPAPIQPRAPPEPAPEAAYTAQVLGQAGQTRGLKGGQPVLEQARTAYLDAAYSGPADRRPRPGRVTKTEI